MEFPFMTCPEVLSWLEARGSRRNVEGMARYGITSAKVFGVSMATMKPLARRLRGGHRLALELWESGWYEARILAALIDDPDQLTRSQMNRWARTFDNWAVCDTACFHLFDKSPLAWEQARKWAASEKEFVRRASFALMASLALHDRATGDEAFVAMLPLIERSASDGRNFVKKGVSWALRGIGSRSAGLHRRATTLARRLARSQDPSVRWTGKDALADLSRPIVRARIERRRGRRPRK
jgi:3-methyladenine DNA glycosylase AlkD